MMNPKISGLMIDLGHGSYCGQKNLWYPSRLEHSHASVWGWNCSSSLRVPATLVETNSCSGHLSPLIQMYFFAVSDVIFLTSLANYNYFLLFLPINNHRMVPTSLHFFFPFCHLNFFPINAPTNWWRFTGILSYRTLMYLSRETRKKLHNFFMFLAVVLISLGLWAVFEVIAHSFC